MSDTFADLLKQIESLLHHDLKITISMAKEKESFEDSSPCEDSDDEEPSPSKLVPDHMNILMKGVLDDVTEFTELETMPPTQQELIAGALRSLAPCLTIESPFPPLSKITYILIRSCTDDMVSEQTRKLAYEIITEACRKAALK